MSRASWTRVKQVFHEALERTDLERAGYVGAACGDDAELRAQVEALLAAHEEADEFLASPTAPETDEITRGAGAVAAADAPEGPGSRIGPYKLLQKIGEGGFGVVYMAEQVEPVKRRVALKIIKVGMDTREVIARFEAERQALAMMDHPNIAKVLDAGSTGTGRPYFVMELVKGVPITEYCDASRLSTRERLELFVMVCNAVQHAHQKGVIHRDLKPSNVMVTLHDGAPVPKVIDFGIAKATAQQLTERTLFTRYGQFIGTPAYMSPEQAEMSGLEVDTRTDIYSLGVLLYELLTGTTPLDSRALRRGAYFEILRVLREEEPPRPSMRLSTLGEQLARVAERRRVDPRALAKLIRGDLDWIAMKALEKDRTRRYDSASELARDIARYFDDEAVTARPPSAAYRLRKTVKKHRGPVGAAAAVLAAILLGGTIALWQGVQAQRQGGLARASAILASATAAQDPLLKALLVDEIADVPDLPGKLAVLRDVANDPLPTTVVQPVERPSQWEYSADGRYVAASFRDGTARVWRTDGTGEPRVLRHPAPVHGVEFSPDGRRIVTGSADGSLRIWEVDGTGMPVELPGHEPGGLWIMRFSPDGERIAAHAAGVITVWPADGDGAPTVLRVDGVDLNGPEWSPSGDRILAGGSDGTARIWSADGVSAPLELPGHGSGRPRGEFTPDGERIVVRGGDGNVRVAPADGAAPPSLLVREDPALESFSVAPDGRHVVMGYLDGTVRVLPIDGTGEPIVFRPGAAVEHAELTRDGTRLLAGSWDGKVRAFRARSTVPVPHLDAIQPPGAVSFSGPPGLAEWDETYDGSQIAVGFWGDATIRTWRADDTGEAAVLFRSEAAVFDARFSPDGEKIAVASDDGSVRLLSADGSGSPIVLAGHDDSSRRLAFSPDGRRLVTSSRDSTARIWRTDGTGDPIVLQHPGWVYSAAFSPDGDRVATACYDGRVRVWALRDPSSPVVVQEHEGVAVSVAFSPDGARVASGSWDGTARIIAADGGGEPVVLQGTGDIWEVAFSPDGRLLATAGDQGEVRIWHADGRGQVAELRGHQGHVGGIAFSPDGSRIVTASHDGTARVWRVDGSDEPIVLRGHESRVANAHFSPDGSRVVTASWDGTVRTWRVTWPALLDYVRARLRACLTPEQRTRFLGESRSEASAAHAECERRLRGKSEVQFN